MSSILNQTTGKHTVDSDNGALARKDDVALSWTTSYPSRLVRFLRKLDTDETSRDQALFDRTNPTPARVRLNVVIVGAGLGGLVLDIALGRRGHWVRILEQAPKLGEIGAGIQIPPNSARLLRRWEVMQYLEKWLTRPEGIDFRRWENGKIVGHTALEEAVQADFDEPYCAVHRTHLHDAMLHRALQLGVKVDLGCGWFSTTKSRVL
ncbi:oxidoreductase [Ascochyta rabiei]|uniref:Oxidoreductase n=1 Tax=Didymella rabiei TaxID=5454 RepID=A0A163KR78_DIDRA|nr:oxidoreductase [Ascochyta rabiei]